MSTRYRSDDDIENNTPNKKSKHSSSPPDTHQSENVPLDVLKAEARERRNSESDVGPADLIEADDYEDHCIICLQPVVDRTVLINCAHDRMCFGCIKQWCEQSRRCPLCNSAIGSHLIHRIRSQYDYQKYYLTPLRTTPPPANIVMEARAARRARVRRDTRSAEDVERDEFDRAVEKRRWVYRNGLFAKHVASNRHTRFRPNPTPQQISNSQELQSRCQMFVRRELRVWPNLDVEFLTSFILSLVKAIDVRTEAAIKLISEFLDMGGRTSPAGGTIAEHFVHELYSYLRSPFRDLPAYDAVVQYDTPSDTEAPPPMPQPRQRLNSNSPGPSRRQISPSPYSREGSGWEPSDPLEASPRDRDSFSEQEDWVEPPPAHSKGKTKENRISREPRMDHGRCGSNRRTDDGRLSQQLRKADTHRITYRESGGKDPKSHYDSSRLIPSRDRRYLGEDMGYPSSSSKTERSEGSSRREHRADKDNATRRRWARDSEEGIGKSYLRKPAGWDNFFAGAEQPQQTAEPRSSFLPRSRSGSPALSSPERSSSWSPYGPRRRSSSPVGQYRRPEFSCSRASDSDRPLTTSASNRSGDKVVEQRFLEHDLATVEHLNTPNVRDQTDTPQDAINEGHALLRAKPKLAVRSRPARTTPIDAIRMHLQESTRTPPAVPVTSGDTLLRYPEAELDHPDTTLWRNGPDSKGESSSLVDSKAVSSPIPDQPTRLSMRNHHTLDDAAISRHDTTTSDNTPLVSLSIRGAAARPNPQSTSPSAADSTERAAPGPGHGTYQTNQVRSRLLARLEAAKSVGTISNGDTEASHLAQKPAHRPTQSEISESPVSDDQIAAIQEEERLRLMARSRIPPGATTREESSPSTPQGSNVACPSHQEKKSDDLNVPAGPDSPTAMETERRLRLQARLGARKREIATLMGAASSADALPRGSVSGRPAIVDRAP